MEGQMLASISSRVFRSILLTTSILVATFLSIDNASAEDYSIKLTTLNTKQDSNNKELQNRLVRHTQDAMMLYKAGNRELDSKDYANAIASYQKAIRLDPSFPPVHYNLGMAHLAIGHKQEAAHYLRAFLELRPNASNANEVKDLIKLLSN